MKCLVLGASGFLGSELTRRLVDSHHQVTTLCRTPTDFLRKLEQDKKIQANYFDFFTDSRLEELVRGQDVIFHLVASHFPSGSNAEPYTDAKKNILGSMRLMELASKLTNARVIYISSGGTVYGKAQSIPIPESHPTEPQSAYGVSKLAVEKYLKLYHQLHELDYIVLRLANPYGVGQLPSRSQGVVPILMNKMMRQQPIEIWGDGNIVRDYFYVSDAIEAMLKSMTYQGAFRLFNVGSGKGLSLNDLLQRMGQTLEIEPEVQYVQKRNCDVDANVLDVNLIKSEMNFQTTRTLTDGLKMTADWLKTLS